MDFQFFIAYTNDLGETTTTEIDEPKGWDGINFHLQRDDQWHGFFDFVDDTMASLSFIGDGRDILQAAYDTDGVEALCTLTVSISCQPGDAYTVIYVGSFDFTSYKFTTSDTCFVEIGVETNTSLMWLKNRYDQPVDLDSLASFDQLNVQQTLTGIPASFTAPNTITLNELNQNLIAGQPITISGAINPANNGIFQIIGLSFIEPDPIPEPVTLDLTQSPEFQVTYFSPNQIQFPIVIPQLQVGCVFSTASSSSPGNTNDVTNVVAVAVETTPEGTLVTLSGSPFASDVNYPPNTGTPTAAIMQITVTSYIAQTIISVLQQSIITEASVGTPENINATTFYPAPNMVPYNGLNKVITLKSKIIQFTSRWQATVDEEFDTMLTSMSDCPSNPNGWGGIFGFTPDWRIAQSDITTTEGGTATSVEVENYSEDNPPDNLIFVAPGFLTCEGKANFNFSIQGIAVNHIDTDTNAPCIPLSPYTIHHIDLLVYAYTSFDTTTFANQTGQSGPYFWRIPLGTTSEFNVTGSFVLPNFGDGYYLWAYIEIYADNTADLDCCYPDILLKSGSFFEFNYESTCESTDTSAYMINETLSRCAEAYTNDALRVYSDYFGRPDAQPYTSPVIGCGALECIMNGLKIRNAAVANTDSRIKMTVSLSDCFSSLDAIHNIGMGLEADPNRAGYQRLRIEPIDHFYQQTVILTCNNIRAFTRELDTKMIASVFKCGYQKFETWNNNGLYDLFGGRTWVTTLNQLQNTIDKTSKFLASDYAIEFTRRMYGNTSSDGRYDNDIFILCLTNKYIGVLWFYGDGSTIILNDALAGIENGDILSLTAPGTVPLGNHTVVSSVIQTLPPVITIACSNTNKIQFYVDGDGALTIQFPSVLTPFQEGDIFNIETNGGGSTSNDGTGYVVLTVLNLPLWTQITVQPPDPPFNFNTFNETIGTVTINFTRYLPQTIIKLTAAIPSVSGETFNGTITDNTNPIYLCEQGNISNPVNILNPETVLNWRITPARNALRQFKSIIMAYRQYQTGVLSFKAGTANFYAFGELIDACAEEGVLLGEGVDLVRSLFSDESNANPLFLPELVKYEYPIPYDQFLELLANPYGMVGFQSGDLPVEYGYIEEVAWKAINGMCQFTLRPKPISIIAAEPTQENQTILLGGDGGEVIGG